MELWAQTPITIVALGDSTTAGTPGFQSPAEVPPSGSGNEQSQYAYWITRRHPQWRVLNRGVNGERSDQILRRFKSDVVSFKPQVVIVLAGVNDLYQGHPADRVKDRLKRIYEEGLQEKIRVLACTILPYNGADPAVQARMREVNGWIREYARERGFGFCDTFKILEDPNHPGNLVSTSDGLHPDAEGYRKMGEAIADYLEGWPAAETRGPTGGAPFRPAWWCRGPNAQTIWGSVLRPSPRVPLKRERWETPDGDFIDLDRLSAAPGAPILIVLHGLEGSSRSKQVLGLLEAAHRQGWAGLGMNFRSCSGELNRLPRSYHGGETSDLSWVIQRVRAENPGVSILCAGVSLGGNVLLKYLGEQGEGLPPEVVAAAAISTPFDLAASARRLEQGFSRF